MTAVPRTQVFISGMLLLACLAGTVSAASIGTEWKERAYGDSPFSGVEFSKDGDYVWAGGSQMIVCSWDGSEKWGGRAGFITAMTGDLDRIVTGIGQGMFVLNKNTTDIWSRNMEGPIRAVAISNDGRYVISSDEKGNYNSWSKNGDRLLARTTDNLAKQIAVSPTNNLVVATTVDGLRFYTPTLTSIWSDNKSGSLDTWIIITSDGKTVITAGGNRVSSYTSDGEKNWMVYPTTEAIIDIAANPDGSAIIIGSQDGTVLAVDRYGKTRWTYKAGQWINAVAISDTATVIAAGGLDGTVYLFDRAGSVIAKKKMESGIQPRSLALSSNGKRLAVADMRYLYALSVIGGGDTPEVVSTYTPPPLEPVRTYWTWDTPTPEPTTVVPTIETTIPPTTPAPAPTQQSPAGVLPLIGALGAAAVVLAGLRRK